MRERREERYRGKERREKRERGEKAEERREIQTHTLFIPFFSSF